MRISRTALLGLSLLLAFQNAALAQIPGPDSTFGLNGAAVQNIYHTDDQGVALALRPDGRAVLAGRTTIDSVPQMAVFQFLPNGKPDLSFHWNAKGALSFNMEPSAAHAIDIDASGRVVLAGYGTENGDEQFGIIRLLPNGAYDPTFGNNGRVLTDFNNGQDQANAVVIQPDGKIIAAGFTKTGGDADIALARYLSDGTLDAGFGTGGKVSTKVGTLSDIARDIALQPDGKILICGSTADVLTFNNPSYFVLARYAVDGKLDLTFGSTGVITTDVNADEENDIARSLAILPNGRIVVAGYSAVSLASKISVVRYRASGLIDNTFGKNGALTTEVKGYGNFCTKIQILPDQSLMLSGMAENIDFKDVFLVKLRSAGVVDSTFGLNGRVIRSLSPKDDNAWSMALRTDGRILVAGDTRADGAFYTDATLLQFNANGSKDASFGDDGVVLADLGTSEDKAHALLLLPDGKLFLGGQTYNQEGFNDWAMVQYQANGMPDAAFGVQGVKTQRFPPATDALLNALALRPDGKVLAAGSIGNKAAMAMLTPDGALENTFGQGGKTLVEGIKGASFSAAEALPDNKVLAAGYEYDDNTLPQALLMRFQADGLPDASFGILGKVVSPGWYWNQLKVLPDGKILTVGSSTAAPPFISRFRVSRFHPDGSLDVSFGQSGNYEYTGPSARIGSSLAIQKDGKIVVSGNDSAQFMAFRLTVNGQPDPDFGQAGIVMIQKGASPQNFETVLIQKDQRILLFGGQGLNVTEATAKGLTVARLHPDGSPDDLWGNQGMLFLPGYLAKAAALDADGNILVAGNIYQGERSDFILYRLLRGAYVGTVDRPDAYNLFLNVFPNPVQNSFTLEYSLLESQVVDIQLYNLEGRLLHTLLAQSARPPGKNIEHLQLPEGLTPGMYCVVVKTLQGQTTLLQVLKK